MQEPWGSSTVNTEEILSGLCFSFAPSDAKTQTGRARREEWDSPYLTEQPLSTWSDTPNVPLASRQFGKVTLSVKYLLFSRKLVYAFFLQSGGQQGSTAAAILCVCRSPVSSSQHPSLIFPSLMSCFKPGAGGEEWMTFSCLRFLCQKISKRHSSSLKGYNQSIPGHNKLGPIKS